MTKTEALKTFLANATLPDLASLYNAGMECQVNVAQDGGERVEKSFRGKLWHGYTDGTQTWKSFRIPFNAATEPSYEDNEIGFSLAEHAEGIGMTGWDWKNKCSRWVAFDFDAITGHSEKHAKKLSAEELESLRKILQTIPWVTLRRSTSGKGLHVYVAINNIPTANHTEHAALARSILSQLSVLTGTNFSAKVDVCGGNMWVWHRKMQGTNGLELLKRGCIFTDIPINWREHVEVISHKRSKIKPANIKIDELAAQSVCINIDEEHKKLIEYLSERNDHTWWWDSDNHMLVCHTKVLKDAHTELQLRGIFETTSPGTDLGEQNCFCFPTRKGSWVVRRFNPGTAEAKTWEQDSSGWTRCYLNRVLDLATAARAREGIEDTDGSFSFPNLRYATGVMKLLGISVEIDEDMMGRPASLKAHKDGRLIVRFSKYEGDRSPEGWIDKKKWWVKIYNASVSITAVETEAVVHDEMLRHMVTGNSEDAGWAIFCENNWSFEPLNHAKLALQSTGVKPQEANNIVGACVLKPWKLVSRPFEPEYPGNREWNLFAAQLRFKPLLEKDGISSPTWDKILNHVGHSLTPYIEKDKWCKNSGILTGGDYLKCWCANLIRHPFSPLPFLFLYGAQQSGKSIFHEALQLLFTKGYTRAEHALTANTTFNGELEGSILCVIEEIDLSKASAAYNRIKDWVTARSISIRKLYSPPYMAPNTTHWIQVANNIEYCPIFPGDTRITMIRVDDITSPIPKGKLIEDLLREAPAFITELYDIDLPDAPERLNLPVIETAEKGIVQQANRPLLEIFIEENCQHMPGHFIKFSEFYSKFSEYAMKNGERWSEMKTGRGFRPPFIKGRLFYELTGQMEVSIGNIAWSNIVGLDVRSPYVLKEGILRHESSSSL